MVRVGADVSKRSGIAIVEVDANNLSTIAGRRALHVNVALALLAAVATGTVDFAVVFGVKIDDLGDEIKFQVINGFRGY